MSKLLIITAILVAWLLLGFIGFLIEAKQQGYTEFDSEVESEFRWCVALGMITFITMINYLFKSVMSWFLKQMNKEKR